MQDSADEQAEPGLPDPPDADGVDAPIASPEPNSGGADAGAIEPVLIEDQMRTAYLDYALSVIVRSERAHV